MNFESILSKLFFAIIFDVPLIILRLTKNKYGLNAGSCNYYTVYHILDRPFGYFVLKNGMFVDNSNVSQIK